MPILVICKQLVKPARINKVYSNTRARSKRICLSTHEVIIVVVHCYIIMTATNNKKKMFEWALDIADIQEVMNEK